MTRYPFDPVDLQILQCLMENASRSNKEIGQLVHLTGQAVGARIRKLEDMGVIEGYTIRWNPEKIGRSVHALITVFMKEAASHQRFQSFLQNEERIEEAHRVSGEGCYWLRVRIEDNDSLNRFLDKLLEYGNYKVSLSLGKVKGY